MIVQCGDCVCWLCMMVFCGGCMCWICVMVVWRSCAVCSVWWLYIVVVCVGYVW